MARFVSPETGQKLLARIEIRNNAQVVVDLGKNGQLLTCSQCVLLTDEGDPTRTYMPQGGTLIIKPGTDPKYGDFHGQFEQAKFHEVTVDPTNFLCSPVDGGGCLTIAQATLDFFLDTCISDADCVKYGAAICDAPSQRCSVAKSCPLSACLEDQYCAQEPPDTGRCREKCYSTEDCAPDEGCRKKDGEVHYCVEGAKEDEPCSAGAPCVLPFECASLSPDGAPGSTLCRQRCFFDPTVCQGSRVCSPLTGYCISATSSPGYIHEGGVGSECAAESVECAPEGGKLWGICEESGGKKICRARCELGCGVGEECDYDAGQFTGLPVCRRMCDPFALDPKCAQGELCSWDYLCRPPALLLNHAVQFGDPCVGPPWLSPPCASDGKAARGVCSDLRNQGTFECLPACERVWAPCADGSECKFVSSGRSGVCGCSVFGEETGCKSGICAAGECIPAESPGLGIALGEPCSGGGVSCASDGKRSLGWCRGTPKAPAFESTCISFCEPGIKDCPEGESCDGHLGMCRPTCDWSSDVPGCPFGSSCHPEDWCGEVGQIAKLGDPCFSDFGKSSDGGKISGICATFTSPTPTFEPLCKLGDSTCEQGLICASVFSVISSVFGVCTRGCDPLAAVPGCSDDQICVPTVQSFCLSKAHADPAKIGEKCKFSSEWDLCGVEGGVAWGRCHEETCFASCDAAHPCPEGQTCTTFGATPGPSFCL